MVSTPVQFPLVLYLLHHKKASQKLGIKYKSWPYGASQFLVSTPVQVPLVLYLFEKFLPENGVPLSQGGCGFGHDRGKDLRAAIAIDLQTFWYFLDWGTDLLLG